MSTSILLCLLLLGLPEPRVEGLRVLGLFPIHGKSQFNMGERLMLGLAERGHQVDVFSHFPQKKPPPNYTDYSLRGSLPAIVNNMSFEIVNDMTASDEVKIIADDMSRPICDLMRHPVLKKLIDSPPTDPPYDVVVMETFMASCYLAFGRHLKIPLVNLVTTATFDWIHEPMGNPVNLATDASVFSKFTSLETFLDRLKNFFLWKYVNWSYDYHTRYQNDIVKEVFGPGYPSVMDLQRETSLVLINNNLALHGMRPFTPAVVPVGGVHIHDSGDDLPPKVQKFLDESKDGFIYVSFGSMVRIETLPKSDVEAFYKTFEKISPVRVLMKIAVPEELPAGLAANVITHSWLPQVKVLKHKNIKAFVTHGGLMGTLESICFGVPMVGFPLFGDQYLNVELYVRKNLAIQLDRFNITESSLSEAVLKILKNPIYKKSAEKMGKAFRDVPMSPMDTAAFWIEYIVRHGKDSLRSPIVDMPWWQAHLIDVYAFIASVVLIALFILKLVLRKFIRLFSSNTGQTKMKKN